MFSGRNLNNRVNHLHERAPRIVYNDSESTFPKLPELDNSVSIHHRNICILATKLYKMRIPSNKGIKQTISSQRIVLIGYWRTVQRIMKCLQQRETGCTSWTKTSRLQSQIGVAIFASFWQEKPWRQNRTPSPFFVIVSLSMRHYVQADLLSHANIINVVLESSP